MSSSQRNPTSEAHADQEAATRERRGSIERLRDALENPGTVKINVKGAFIVDEEEQKTTDAEEKSDDSEDGGRDNTAPAKTRSGQGRSKDIRLPHHTDVVSHVAVDVRSALVHIIMA